MLVYSCYVKINTYVFDLHDKKFTATGLEKIACRSQKNRTHAGVFHLLQGIRRDSAAASLKSTFTGESPFPLTEWHFLATPPPPDPQKPYFPPGPHF